MKNTIAIAAVVIVVGLIAMLWIEPEPFEPGTFPWEITVRPDGSAEVFGLVTGVSTLADANHRFGPAPEVAVFSDSSGPRSVEAYYDSVVMAGLKAKVILELAVEPSALATLEAGAIDREATPSGSYRSKLAIEDVRTLLATPIQSITYIPGVDLEKETLRLRFGDPSDVRPAANDSEYWMYPGKGLAIAVNADGREVMQYVAPRDFERLRGVIEEQLAREEKDGL
jgi:hypothetical protein